MRASGLEWRIARLATVYGRGDVANFRRLASALRRGRFVIPGDGGARKSVLPIEKAGELLAAMALRADGARAVLNLASPETPTLAEICESFTRECGFRRPPRVPLTLLRALAGCGDVAAAVGLRFPFTSSVLSKLTTSTVVNVARMQAWLPPTSWPSFQESIASAREDYAMS